MCGGDKNLEEMAAGCQACQSAKQAPAAAPLHPWIWPTKPWQRVHVDFAGPIQGKMYFIAVDAHSKWPEVVEMTGTTSAQTIAVLRRWFAAYGLPEQTVSDNGPQFISAEFQRFLQANGVKHIRCSLYHPASNGVVEGFVRTFKQTLKASRCDGRTMQHTLQNFLLVYRTTPHATTHTTPCVFFLGRSVRTRLDMIWPDLEQRVMEKQASQKACHDQHAHHRKLEVGQPVLVRNTRADSEWIPGVVLRQLGPVTYLVELEGGRSCKRHIDHLKGMKKCSNPIPDS